MTEHDAVSRRGLTDKRLTLLDVANALGVSRTTVSNAFNRPHRLSPGLREDVINKARELGYFGPDPAARALRRTGVHEVAVIFHHDLCYALSDPPSVEFLKGVSIELDRRRLTLQIIPKMGRRLDLGAAFQTTADALIVHAEVDLELANAVRSLPKPVVLVDSIVEGAVSINSQDRHGAEMAMAHALSMCPDQVLVLTFPLDDDTRARALSDAETLPHGYLPGERVAGYANAARAAGYALERIRWIEVDDTHPESAGQVVAALCDQFAPGCRLAVLAMSDRMALAVQAAVRGWNGPEVVAIVGYDDIAAASVAGLTTVRQNHQLKGQRAVQALLDGVVLRPLPVELVVRRT